MDSDIPTRHVIVTASAPPGMKVPRGWTCRTLVLFGSDGRWVVYAPLVEYFASHPSKSLAWQQLAVRVTGLLFDFCTARGVWAKDWDVAGGTSAWRLLRDFATTLQYKLDDDANALGWEPVSNAVLRRLFSALDSFEKERRPFGVRNPLLSPMSDAQRLSATLSAVARHRMSVLSHLGFKEPNSETAVPFVDSVPGTSPDTQTYVFPPEQVENVLWNGFLRPGCHGTTYDDYHVRDMMIFLLQNGVGLREHEPFHLWVGDICEDPEHPGTASVRLYHPEKGLAFRHDINGRAIMTTRENKLREFGLVPRTRGRGGYRVGWKHGAVSGADFAAELYWVDGNAKALLWELYKYYLGFRQKIIERRLALGYTDHPFLFVSERENRNAPDGMVFYGAPASIEAYDGMLKRAVNSVGLRSNKKLGTTSHGPRHLYAKTLKELDVKPKTLQICLRHTSPFSSDRYGQPTPSEISAELNQKTARRREDKNA